MAKKLDPLQAKAARQKKLAIGGGVLLLALLAFQVPRTMKMLHPPTDASSSAATPSTSTPLAPPVDGGGAANDSSASSVKTSKDGVMDPSAPLPPSSGQLINFNRFKSKDPFKQQISDCGPENPCGSGTAAPTASSGGDASGGGSGASAGGAGGVGGGSAPAPKTAPAKTAVKLSTATISVNGVAEKLGVGNKFPTADPVFVLVSLSAKSAKIGISGGTLDSGAGTVTLQLGKTVKLQNTADQAMYVLKLVAVS
jgi:hypothetical protein